MNENGRTFTTGDHVEIVCRDGKRFAGTFDHAAADYVLIGGRGFPWDDVVVMQHA